MANSNISKTFCTRNAFPELAGHSLQGGASVTVNIDDGFIIVYRNHSNPSLNLFCVIAKVSDRMAYVIADTGAVTGKIEITAVTNNSVTIKNNHSIAVYGTSFC